MVVRGVRVVQDVSCRGYVGLDKEKGGKEKHHEEDVERGPVDESALRQDRVGDIVVQVDDGVQGWAPHGSVKYEVAPRGIRDTDTLVPDVPKEYKEVGRPSPAPTDDPPSPPNTTTRGEWARRTPGELLPESERRRLVVSELQSVADLPGKGYEVDEKPVRETRVVRRDG